MSGALNGLKIIDFSTLLPGPFATMMLADLGAEVIHVESPTRVDLLRIMPPYANGQATAHSYLNRNKQSIALDLKDKNNIDLIKEKIKQFDILVEQFRPEVMQRLGLGYEELAKIHPKLIYCSITGYGQTGDYKSRAGHDINYLALSGIAGHSGRQTSGPPPLGVQVADVAGGSLHAVIGILAAVIEREKSGLGQHIDISMTDCAVGLNNMAASAVLAAGSVQKAETGTLNGAGFYDYYKTADDRYLAIGSLEPQFMQGLAQILDLPILLQKGASFIAEEQQAVKNAIGQKIIQHSQSYWIDVFKAQDVCVEPVLYLDEALSSDLAKARAWVVDVPLADGGTEPQLAHPIQFSRSRPRYDFVGQPLGTGKWEN